MKGRSTRGTTGLGTVEVSGRRRVPSPPTKITACISGPSGEHAGVWSSENQACRGRREGTVVVPRTRPRTKAGAGLQPIQAPMGLQEGPLPSAYSLIDEPRPTHRNGVQRVAPVDHKVAAHRLGDLAPVERQELGHSVTSTMASASVSASIADSAKR